MGGKPKKLLEQIHPLHIIKEVQKWPALYVKDTTDRPNAHFKKKLWCEVAKALFPEWETFTKVEMDNKATDLAKRWRNLRDTFRRQAEVERKNREGADIKKKMYVYYSHMSFLLPHISLGDSDEEPAREAAPPRRRRRAGDRPPAPLSLCLDDIDEDKHFLMSLVPSFKKMSEEEKLTVKVEILKVIRGVRSSPSSSAHNYQVLDSLAYNTEPSVIIDDGHVKKEMLADVGNVDLEASDVDEDSDE